MLFGLLVADSAGDAESEFLARYEPAAKKLEEAYSKVTLRAVCTRIGWPAYKDTGGKRVARLVIRRNGPDIRIDETELVEQNGTLVEKGCLVRTVRARGGFRAARDAGETEFKLLDLAPPLEPRTHWIHGEYKFIHAPYGRFGLSIPAFLREPGVTVTAVREITENGEQLVEVSWEDQELGAVGWFRFLPEKQWVVREFASWAKDLTAEKMRTDPNRGIGRGRIEYGEETTPVPVMRQVSYWKERGTSQTREHLEIIEIEDVTFGEIPENEFTLAALETSGPEAHTNRGRFLVLFAIGALSLLAAILLARRLRKGPV